MKKILNIILISCFSLTVISCGLLMEEESTTTTVAAASVTIDYALDFDGTNDNVSANGVATELNSTSPAANLPLSVSAWVYPDDGTKEQLVFGFFKNNAFANGPSVWYGAADLKFSYYDQTPTYDNSSSTYAINIWHHVVLTIGSDRDGVLYVNGSSAATFSGYTHAETESGRLVELSSSVATPFAET